MSNDLAFDQRMQRTCTALEELFEVTLVGRVLPDSPPLIERNFSQTRLPLKYHRGKLFYLELNWRLYRFLHRQRPDLILAVDLDTLMAAALAARRLGVPYVYDAHEYFTETPELVGRPLSRAIWDFVGRMFIRGAEIRYTVNESLSEILSARYGAHFGYLRNMPSCTFRQPRVGFSPAAKYMLYQGALNKGRGVEELIEAMPSVSGLELWIAGEGDLSQELRKRAAESTAAERIRFLGRRSPEDLRQLTASAWLGFNLLSDDNLNYRFSLANKFFDYVQAHVPQVCMDFPEYARLNSEHEVSVLVPDKRPETVIQAVRRLQADPALYRRLQTESIAAAEEWTWEREQKRLIEWFKPYTGQVI